MSEYKVETMDVHFGPTRPGGGRKEPYTRPACEDGVADWHQHLSRWYKHTGYQSWYLTCCRFICFTIRVLEKMRGGLVQSTFRKSKNPDSLISPGNKSVSQSMIPVCQHNMSTVAGLISTDWLHYSNKSTQSVNTDLRLRWHDLLVKVTYLQGRRTHLWPLLHYLSRGENYKVSFTYQLQLSILLRFWVVGHINTYQDLFFATFSAFLVERTQAHL